MGAGTVSDLRISGFYINGRVSAGASPFSSKRSLSGFSALV